MTTSNIAAHGSAPASLSVGQVSGCGGGGAFGAGIQGGDNAAEFGIAPQHIDCQMELCQRRYISSDSYGAGGDGLRLYTYRAVIFYLHHRHFILD